MIGVGCRWGWWKVFGVGKWVGGVRGGEELK